MGLLSRRKPRITEHPSQHIVERYIHEAFIGGSPGVLEATVSDEQLRRIVPVFWNAFADRRMTINHIFTSADSQLVAANATFEGRHVGPWLNIQPTGKAVTLETTAIFRVVDGKISERWLTWDWLPLVR